MRVQAVLLVGIAALFPSEIAAESSCLSKDKTGLNWVHPFPKALEKAKAERRLLMIKPVAFGTTRDGGW